MDEIFNAVSAALAQRKAKEYERWFGENSPETAVETTAKPPRYASIDSDWSE